MKKRLDEVAKAVVHVGDDGWVSRDDAAQVMRELDLRKLGHLPAGRAVAWCVSEIARLSRKRSQRSPKPEPKPKQKRASRKA